jgi:hypothetical protein
MIAGVIVLIPTGDPWPAAVHQPDRSTARPVERGRRFLGLALVQGSRADGRRFEADLLYYGWPTFAGFSVAVASAIGGWGIGEVILGSLLGVLGLSLFLCRIKYGRAYLRDIPKLIRGEPAKTMRRR